MVALMTPKIDYDFTAPEFSLQNIDGEIYSLDDLKGESGTVVAFICNHCPYVMAIADKMAGAAKEMQEFGVNFIAIMPNDFETYPQDSFENMREVAREKGFEFPYLIDATQDVARNYGAVCTPDFFGFDKDLILQYRGRFDDSERNFKPDSPIELVEAMRMIAQNGKAPDIQNPSVGCSIKWKLSGND